MPPAAPRGPLPIGRPAAGRRPSPSEDPPPPTLVKRGRLRRTVKIGGIAVPVWVPLAGLGLVTAAETGRIDGPHRELFFNIADFWVLYALLPLLVAVVVYGLARRARVWRIGRPDFHFDQPRVRLRRMLRGGAGTERVLRDPYAGVMHLCIMSSILVLFLVTALLAIDDYLPDDKVRILVGDRYLGYSLVGDLFGLIGLIGVGMAVAHRWVRPRTTWLPSTEDKLILGGLGLLLVTGFLLDEPSCPSQNPQRGFFRRTCRPYSRQA